MGETEIYRAESSGLSKRLLSVLNIPNDDIPVKQCISLMSRLKLIKKKNHLFRNEINCLFQCQFLK